MRFQDAHFPSGSRIACTMGSFWTGRLLPRERKRGISCLIVINYYKSHPMTQIYSINLILKIFYEFSILWNGFQEILPNMWETLSIHQLWEITLFIKLTSVNSWQMLRVYRKGKQGPSASFYAKKEPFRCWSTWITRKSRLCWVTGVLLERKYQKNFLPNLLSSLLWAFTLLMINLSS